MTAVFLNGRFYSDRAADAPIADARLSAFDAGLQHAVGLFETLRGGVRKPEPSPAADGPAPGAGTGWCYRLDEHLQRLRQSAAELGLSESINPAALAEAVLQTIEHAGLASARVRLTVTAGDLNMLSRAAHSAGSTPQDPTILIVAQPATVYPDAMFERGVSVVVADTRANPLNPFEGHKTLNYWWRLRALQAAASRGAGESIVLQVSNHLAGGCVSNVFLVKDGELRTPIVRGEEAGPDSGGHQAPPRAGALPSPVLPGITRGAIREFSAGLGITCRAEMLSVQELLDADEVFLTNSSWGVLPVVSVLGLGEKRAIADGVPGKITTRLRRAWTEDVARAELE
ncbi:MAG: aminotransferase class IV [Phycisphaerales bacterium]